MTSLYIWILIFCLGLALYFAPVFLFDRRYEGFADAVATEGVPEEDPTKYLKQLKALLEPQAIGTPDFAFTASPTLPPAQPPLTSGTVKTPEPVDNKCSKPALPNPTPDTKTPAIEQGANFQQTKPNPTLTTVTNKAPVLSTASPASMFVPIDALAAKAAHKPQPTEEPEPVIKQEKHKCPPAPKCPPARKCPKCPPAPQCPDMRDYIRKDSIPCWACKLK